MRLHCRNIRVRQLSAKTVKKHPYQEASMEIKFLRHNAVNRTTNAMYSKEVVIKPTGRNVFERVEKNIKN